jgi:hypothetical protein
MSALDAPPIDQDSLRLRGEFLEMPGLTVNVPQAARLFGIRLDHAAMMLDLLVLEGFLVHDEHGQYHRPARD